MISIITSIYNQLAMNQLFFKTVDQYTDVPYELIVIDNCSDDGSREFFKSLGSHVRVIENDQNYPYSYCQNQGINAARYDIYAFLNNDIIVSPKWGSRIISVMEINGLEIVTPCGIERMESKDTIFYKINVTINSF